MGNICSSGVEREKKGKGKDAKLPDKPGADKGEGDALLATDVVPGPVSALGEAVKGEVAEVKSEVEIKVEEVISEAKNNVEEASGKAEEEAKVKAGEVVKEVETKVEEAVDAAAGKAEESAADVQNRVNAEIQEASNKAEVAADEVVAQAKSELDAGVQEIKAAKPVVEVETKDGDEKKDEGFLAGVKDKVEGAVEAGKEKVAEVVEEKKEIAVEIAQEKVTEAVEQGKEKVGDLMSGFMGQKEDKTEVAGEDDQVVGDSLGFVPVNGGDEVVETVVRENGPGVSWSMSNGLAGGIASCVTETAEGVNDVQESAVAGVDVVHASLDDKIEKCSEAVEESKTAAGKIEEQTNEQITEVGHAADKVASEGDGLVEQAVDSAKEKFEAVVSSQVEEAIESAKSESVVVAKEAEEKVESKVDTLVEDSAAKVDDAFGAPGTLSGICLLPAETEPEVSENLENEVKEKESVEEAKSESFLDKAKDLLEMHRNSIDEMKLPEVTAKLAAAVDVSANNVFEAKEEVVSEVSREVGEAAVAVSDIEIVVDNKAETIQDNVMEAEESVATTIEQSSEQAETLKEKIVDEVDSNVEAVEDSKFESHAGVGFLADMKDKVEVAVEAGKEKVTEVVVEKKEVAVEVSQEKVTEVVEQGKEKIGDLISGFTGQKEEIEVPDETDAEINSPAGLIGALQDAAIAKEDIAVEPAKEEAENSCDVEDKKEAVEDSKGDSDACEGFLADMKDKVEVAVEAGKEKVAEVVEEKKEVAVEVSQDKATEVVEQSKEKIGDLMSGFMGQKEEIEVPDETDAEKNSPADLIGSLQDATIGKGDIAVEEVKDEAEKSCDVVDKIDVLAEKVEDVVKATDENVDNSVVTETVAEKVDNLTETADEKAEKVGDVVQNVADKPADIVDASHVEAVKEIIEETKETLVEQDSKPAEDIVGESEEQIKNNVTDGIATNVSFADPAKDDEKLSEAAEEVNEDASVENPEEEEESMQEVAKSFVEGIIEKAAEIVSCDQPETSEELSSQATDDTTDDTTDEATDVTDDALPTPRTVNFSMPDDSDSSPAFSPPPPVEDQLPPPPDVDEEPLPPPPADESIANNNDTRATNNNNHNEPDNNPAVDSSIESIARDVTSRAVQDAIALVAETEDAETTDSSQVERGSPVSSLTSEPSQAGSVSESLSSYDPGQAFRQDLLDLAAPSCEVSGNTPTPTNPETQTPDMAASEQAFLAAAPTLTPSSTSEVTSTTEVSSTSVPSSMPGLLSSSRPDIVIESPDTSPRTNDEDSSPEALI